ncbi:hypothetical protein [Motilimonas sp. KMU-193]|uniref:hypothetical protein n=1 Tax=Motilimonas sp. KMU-193 TaxID=3388668 RepID=UPI00396B1A7D
MLRQPLRNSSLVNDKYDLVEAIHLFKKQKWDVDKKFCGAMIQIYSHFVMFNEG